MRSIGPRFPVSAGVALLAAVHCHCSSSDSGTKAGSIRLDAGADASISAQTPDSGAADAPGEVEPPGMPCSHPSECPAGQSCYFLVSDGCTASGSCQYVPTGFGCYNIVTYCGCEGGIVTTSECPNYAPASPSGYAPAPVAFTGPSCQLPSTFDKDSATE